MSLHASCNHGAPLFVGSPLEDATTGAREGTDQASGTNVQSVLPYNDRIQGNTTRLGTSAPLQQLFGSDNGVSEASMTLCNTTSSGPREVPTDPNELMQDIICKLIRRHSHQAIRANQTCHMERLPSRFQVLLWIPIHKDYMIIIQYHRTLRRSRRQNR